MHERKTHYFGSYPTEEEAAALAREAQGAQDRGELETWLAEWKRLKQARKTVCCNHLASV